MSYWTMVLIAAALVFLLTWAVAFFLSRVVTRPQVRDSDAAADEVCTQMGVSRFRFEQTHPREPFEVQSQYGYTLRGYVIPRRTASLPQDRRERAVVLVHGYTACAEIGWKYVDLFRDMGFSCVLYDHRNHGRSDRRPTTMGRRESDDLLTVLNWTFERFGADAVVGLHGESMGAATVMLTSPRDDRLAFVVEDCGYSDLRSEIVSVCAKQYRIPAFPFVSMASLLFRLDAGVFFRDVRPCAAVEQSGDLPMLFVHGEADDFVPTRMVYECYAGKTTGLKRRFTVPDAGHAECILKDPEGYREAVKEFLQASGVL